MDNLKSDKIIKTMIFVIVFSLVVIAFLPMPSLGSLPSVDTIAINDENINDSKEQGTCGNLVDFYKNETEFYKNQYYNESTNVSNRNIVEIRNNIAITNQNITQMNQKITNIENKILKISIIFGVTFGITLFGSLFASTLYLKKYIVSTNNYYLRK